MSPRDPRSEPANPLWNATSGDQPTNAKPTWAILRKAMEALHGAPRDPVVQPAPVEDVELIGGPSDGERVTVQLHVVSVKMDSGDVYERAGPHHDFRHFGVSE
jgi:hypothetical protein